MRNREDHEALEDVEDNLRGKFLTAARAERSESGHAGAARRLLLPVLAICAFGAVPAALAVGDAIGGDDQSEVTVIDETLHAVECPNGEALVASDAEKEALAEQLDAGEEPHGSEVPACDDGSIPSEIGGYREFGGGDGSSPTPEVP